MTLAELLAEADRLEQSLRDEPRLTVQVEIGCQLARFYASHGPRLASVARAAVEQLRMVAAEGCRDKPGSGVSCREAAVPPADVCEVCKVTEWLSAFDAAAAGERK